MKRTTINKTKLIVAFTLFTSVVFAQWGTNGNTLSSGDFLGSTNSFPLIFKTNNGTRLYITEGGFVGIGTTSPTQALDVNGNLNVSGTSTFGGNMSVTGNITANCFTAACLNIAGNLSIDNITVSRLLSPDGIVHIGDSSISFDYLHNILSATFGTSFTPSTYVKGLKIGRIAPGSNSFKDAQLAFGFNSTAIGFYTGTSANADNAIVMGTGATSQTQVLSNTIPNSLMVAFNSTIPTLFVGPASGAGTIGKIGIGTSDPQRALHVMGTGRFQNGGDYVDVEFNTVHGIINSSKDLLINYYSQKQTIIGPGTLTASGDFTAQNNAYLATATGSVGIGTTDTKGYKLAVNGSMIAESVTVKLNGSWPDFVFMESHKLFPLTEIEKYIKEYKHLPNILSSHEVTVNGINLAQMNSKLLEKIEELTLYLIEQDKRITQLEHMFE